MPSDRTRPTDLPSFKSFEEATLAHLKQYFPRHCQILGDDRMRLVIRDGSVRAVRHRFTEQRCVRSYIDLMCLLGSGFDRDVLMPWAAATLADNDGPSQVARADRLYTQAWHYIARIARDYRDKQGTPTTARFVTEFRRLKQESHAPLKPSQMTAFMTEVAGDLNRVFPAKCQFVGRSAVRASIARATARARRYDIASRRGVKLFSAQMFVLGAGFDRDHLLPWVPAVLADCRQAREDDRVERLLAESVTALRTWWDSAGH